MAALPTGTVTFLFTDIEGSTTLVQRLGDRRYAEILEEHKRLLRDAFAKGNGQEIETQGDAILVAFPRARDAVAAAVAAQRAVTRYAWPQDATPRVRMGLHTGEPLSGTVGYVGLDVHRAARICGAGHGGQILLSDVTQGLVAKDLPEGISLRDLGEHRLKDLTHPQSMFQVTGADLPGDFPPLRSVGSVLQHNLPSQLTSFIGREHEIAEVKTMLASARLVTLTGMGGSGKTRLALRVGADLLGVLPTFRVTPQNAQSVARICHRLDGIPLAIELAAARVKVLAVEQIAARIDDRFRLLTGGSRVAVPRHQTLRAAIEWSYQLLSETERILLRRLAVFAGGWTLEAAEAVCPSGSVEASGILDVLTSLVDKSLVLADMQRGAARYRLLETVRQYARDRLMDAGEDAEVRTRHRAWCLTLVEQGGPELRGPRQRIWLQRFEVEQDNLRAALVWDREDPRGAGLRIVFELGLFWFLRGSGARLASVSRKL
jgi:class 3 adenylate cyclase